MVTLVRCQNPACPLSDGLFEQTRKNNLYCSPACRQAALRNRQKESQETFLDQGLRTLPISVALMIKSISEEYTMEAAMQALSAVHLLLHIADVEPKEVRDLVSPDQQKIADLEMELARYRQICDMSDRKRLEDRFMALGVAFHYHRLMNYNVQPGEENWRTFLLNADDATLVEALVNTEAFYSNWMFFVEATDLKKAERRIAELEQKIERYESSQKEMNVVEDTAIVSNEAHQARKQLALVHAKYQTLLADFMQASKKIGNLERYVQRFARMKILKSRESMLQELMLLGGRLKYASMADLGIQEGIDAWLNHVRGLSDEDLAKAIAHGFHQVDSLAMAVIEASDVRIGMQMRKRINELEGDVRRRDDRIADLEMQKGSHLAMTGEEEIQRLEYAAREWQVTVERQREQMAELQRERERLRTEMGRLKEAHGSTMSHMNFLLAQAQSRLQSVMPLQAYLHAHIGGRIPLQRGKKTLFISYVNDDATACAEGEEVKLTHLSEEEIRQMCRWVAEKQASRVTW